MVLVLIGTQKQDFSRLFKMLENSEELKNEKIIVQSGYTKYEGKKLKCIPFMSHDDLIEKTRQADYIICHGGVGTIFDSMYENKKILAVPRLKKYKEHINDHQIEVCSKLQEEGYILYLKEGENLDEKIKLLKQTNLKEYRNDNNFLNILRKEI